MKLREFFYHNCFPYTAEGVATKQTLLWPYVMDGSKEFISPKFRLQMAKLAMGHKSAAELAFFVDAQSRRVMDITDEQCRSCFRERLFFCGRYELSEGRPIYQTETSLVLLATDLGILHTYGEVFDEHFKEGRSGDECEHLMAALKGLFRRFGLPLNDIVRLEEGNWQEEFQKWDTNENGLLEKEEFTRRCKEQYGETRKVAIKFMRNKGASIVTNCFIHFNYNSCQFFISYLIDQYKREIITRKNLDPQFVVGVVQEGPSEKEIEKQVKEYHFTRFGVSLSDYSYAMIMPYGERSLREIFMSERPSSTTIIEIFRQLATALKYLHSEGWSHGDLKMLNVVRIGTTFRLIGNMYILLYLWCFFIYIIS